MKKIIFLILLNLLTNSIFGQIDLSSSKIMVQPFWKKGEKIFYKNSYHKITIKKNDTITNEVTNYDIKFIVIDESESTYKVNSTYTNINTNSKSEPWRILMTLLKNLDVTFEVNKKTGFEEIINVSELQDSISNRANKIDPNSISKIGSVELMRLVKGISTKKERLELIIGPHLTKYFKHYGYEYKYNEIYESQLQTTTGMTSDNIDTKCILSLDSIDLTKKSFRIQSSDKMNTEQLATAFKEYYKEKYKLSKIPIDIESDFSKLRNETESISIINERGVLINGVYKNYLNMPEINRIETFTINLQ